MYVVNIIIRVVIIFLVRLNCSLVSGVILSWGRSQVCAKFVSHAIQKILQYWCPSQLAVSYRINVANAYTGEVQRTIQIFHLNKQSLLNKGTVQLLECYELDLL